MVYIKLVLTAAFWGGTFIAGRVVAADVGPFPAALLRFTAASVLLMILTRRLEGRFPPLDFRRLGAIMLLGLTGVLAYNAFFFSGLKYVEAGRAAVIVAMNPVSIAVFSALLLRERMSAAKAAGIAISVAGAIVVVSKGHMAGVSGLGLGRGELYVFGCVLSWTAYAMIGREMMRRLSPLATVAYSSVAGTLMLLTPALAEGIVAELPGYGALSWICLAYLGVFGTVVGFTWFYEGVNTIGTVRASQFINFVPIFAVLLSFAILGEPLTLSLLVGAALVITGVSLTNSRRTRRPPPRAEGSRPARDRPVLPR